jgi:hypothetical protein
MRVLMTGVIPAPRLSRRMTMNINVLRSLGRNAVTTGIMLATAVLVSSGAAHAQSDESESRKGLRGAWLVRVTLRDCATNAPLGSFNSLVTFHRGGTISETTSSPAFAIGQRSPGHGTWSGDEHRTFDQRMISLINFDTAPNLPGTPGFNPTLPVTPGFFAGSATVTHRLNLTDENRVTSAGTNAFYKADGTVYRTGCSTAVGQRFE